MCLCIGWEEYLNCKVYLTLFLIEHIGSTSALQNILLVFDTCSGRYMHMRSVQSEETAN